MRRLFAVPAAAVGLVAWTGPAMAHEAISPSSVDTGKAVFLTFTAANERQSPLVSVTLAPPAGLELGAVTREPQGWTVGRGPAGITWSGGTVAPGKFEEWGVELEAPALPGAFTFRSTVRFADGRTDSRDVALTVLSATAPAPPTSVATISPAAGTAGKPAPRRDNLARGMGGAGLVVGLLALVLTARRPGAAGPAAPPPGEQEW